MIYGLIILTILLGVSIFINVNLYKKYSLVEDVASQNAESADNMTQFLEQVRRRVMSQRSYLKQLDRNGAFESDDETGYFFKELKKIVEDISVYFDVAEEIDEESASADEKRPNSYITSRF